MEKHINLNQLVTEERNHETMIMDELSLKEQIHLMNKMDKIVALAIEKELNDIENVIKQTVETFLQGGRIIYCGAGTSGRVGLLDAVETLPTFGVSSDRFTALLAGGSDNFGFAGEEAEDSMELGVEDISKLKVCNKDIVIGIAASGRTPYVIGALKESNRRGAKTVAIACNKHSIIGREAKFKIEVNCGPEFLTGSTRLKAGTAQKLILNMISTITMIQSGKTYKNLMIDVNPTNEKLVERWKGIVMQATECSYEEAEELYIKSNKKAKVAIVMFLSNCSYEEAEMKLSKNKGFIKSCL